MLVSEHHLTKFKAVERQQGFVFSHAAMAELKRHALVVELNIVEQTLKPPARARNVISLA